MDVEKAKDAGKEIWLNPAKGTVYVKTYDRKGELVGVPVRGGKKVAISTEERQINEEMAASEAQDPFLNGSLSPVKLIDSAEDYAEIANNPNVLSESDIVGMFSLTAPQLKNKLKDISNITALNRMVELIEEGAVDPKESQIKAIKGRLTQLSPGAPERPDDAGRETDFKPVSA